MKEEKLKTWGVMDGDDASCKIRNVLSCTMMNAKRTTQAALIAFNRTYKQMLSEADRPRIKIKVLSRFTQFIGRCLSPFS